MLVDLDAAERVQLLPDHELRRGGHRNEQADRSEPRPRVPSDPDLLSCRAPDGTSTPAERTRWSPSGPRDAYKSLSDRPILVGFAQETPMTPIREWKLESWTFAFLVASTLIAGLWTVAKGLSPPAQTPVAVRLNAPVQVTTPVTITLPDGVAERQPPSEAAGDRAWRRRAEKATARAHAPRPLMRGGSQVPRSRARSPDQAPPIAPATQLTVVNCPQVGGVGSVQIQTCSAGN